MEYHLQLGERAIEQVRKHWFVFFLNLLPFVLFAFIPLLLPDLFAFVADGNPAVRDGFTSVLTLANPWTRLVLGLYWLLLWIGAFNVFTRYYLDLWVITTERILYIHQRGFFHREVSSFYLDRVQDVTSEIRGFFPTIIGYGKLFVETAGADANFSMYGVPNPRHLREVVMRQVSEHHQTRNQGFVPKLAQKIKNGLI